jgi:hypothetical protein
LPSLAGDDDACKQRLRGVFRGVVANDPVFARAVDADDTRNALDEVAEYDAFRDGFLVLPTLQSMYVFLIWPWLVLFLSSLWVTNNFLIVWLRYLGRKRTAMMAC